MSVAFGVPRESVSPKFCSNAWCRYGSWRGSAKSVLFHAIQPGGAGQQRAVQQVPVVGGRVGVGGEVGADAELLHDHRLAERARQLAGDGGGVALPDGVVADRVDVRAEEVGHLGHLGQPEAVVVAGDLDAPGAVAERERLLPAGRPDRVLDDPRPGGDDLVAGVRRRRRAASRWRPASRRPLGARGSGGPSRPRTRPAGRPSRRRCTGAGRCARPGPSSRRTCGRR